MPQKFEGTQKSFFQTFILNEQHEEGVHKKYSEGINKDLYDFFS